MPTINEMYAKVLEHERNISAGAVEVISQIAQKEQNEQHSEGPEAYLGTGGNGGYGYGNGGPYSTFFKIGRAHV